MSNLFTQYPLALIFFVCAIGYAVGKINILGGKIGVSAILFIGLIFGAINDTVEIPIIVFELGLVLFVYSIGIAPEQLFLNQFAPMVFAIYSSFSLR